jgi:predicted N-acetyltransferase YhbS
MRRADASLTVTTQEMAEGGVLVCEDENSITGVISVVPMAEDGVFDLMHLFVEPHAVGTGVGRALFWAAVSLMRERGGKKLLILSDPHAAEFYRRLGATDIGEAPSDAIPERLLPLLAFVL